MSRHRFRRAESDEYYFREGCYILEHLNDPADREASIARARVPPGGSTRRHRLIATTERYFVLQGRGSAEVGDDAAVTIAPGDVVLIPAGVSQRVTNLGDDDLIFLAVCTPRFAAENYREL